MHAILRNGREIQSRRGNTSWRQQYLGPFHRAHLASLLIISLYILCGTGCYINRETDTIASEHSRFAVVVPFVENQTARLRKHLATWSSKTACNVSTISSIKLLFYHDSDLSEKGRHEIADMVLSTGSTRECFTAGWDVLHGSVPPDINNHACGACYQFYKLFGILKGKFDYFFIMEPDVIPIRSGWLTALVSETMVSSPGQDFWLKGSNQKCHPFYGEIATRRDWHINGNAIYKLNDRDFEAYLDSVQAYYTGGMEGCPPGCGTGRVYENAYDHALFQFRQEVENFNQSRNLLHKFHYTPIIANLCEEMYNTTDLAEKNPELYLVHSKGPDLSGDYHEIQDAIHKILRRHGSVEVSEYHGMLRSGMEMPHIMYMICERETKPSHFCFKICLDLFTESEFPMRCAKYKEFYYWANRFDDRVYVWSVDFHGAPASCNSEIYEEAGAEFHAEIDFSNCEFHKNCKDRLKILSFDSWRGFGLDPCPNRLRHDFYQHYKDDPEMARVDAIVCSHPAANCELFMPLNKSLIIYATTRIEFGRFDELVAWRQKDIDAQSRYRWEEWARNIVRISKRPGNIIAANNIYDVFYIKYMTGIDAMYLPSWCSPKASWTPRNERDILLGPSRDNLGKPMTTEAAAWQHPLLRSLREANARKGNKFSFTRFGELQDRGKVDIESIAGYRCIVLIPYQASFMSFFEYYRMNIPLFAPSKQLFYDWERKYNISWERVYGLPSPIVGFDHVQKGNPNSFGENASKHWLDLFDIYNFPHVQYFDSWGELLDKLEQTNFVAVSKAMEAYNVNEKGNLIQSWRRIFQNIRKNRIPNAQDLTGTFEDALESLYGTRFIGRDYRAGCSHSEP